MSALPKLPAPRLGLAAFRGRLLFRGAFLLLILATLSLALVLLKEEKQRSYQNYRQNLAKSESEIAARLRHPAGQLALLNPDMLRTGVLPLRPVVLPFSAIDFDDQNKVRQAVEMAGCLVQYADGSSACAGIGNNPYAGGFLYLAGSFLSAPLAGREQGVLELYNVHRARVTLTMRDKSWQWIAPFEAQNEPGAPVHGRLTGFAGAGPDLVKHTRPVREFRGWLWQNPLCADAAQSGPDCPHRAFFSIRLPVEVFRDALFGKPRPVWPPPDLDAVQVRIEMFAPQAASNENPVPIFDSNAGTPTPPFSLADLATGLSAGETLRLRKLGAAPRAVAELHGASDSYVPTAPWMSRLVDRLQVPGFGTTIEQRELISTAAGQYELTLSGELRGVDSGIAAVATRLSWFVGVMLLAIVLAWLVIEVGLIRRIAVLTRRAAAVSHNVQDAQAEARIADLDLTDLRGSDELGILAGGLSDLLQRVQEDVRREQIRAQQERELWHAVGHEIMSPLQSLMVLHPAEDDASRRYIARMQQAVRVLYGTASPSEALQAATLRVEALDLNAFLTHLAANAHFAGVTDVRYTPAEAPLPVRADEFPLEDAVTHILRNAERHRTVGTPIILTLTSNDTSASVTIRNQGPQIDTALLERIFEYGVSDAAPEDSTPNGERRGQGLFVAKTYMAKMGGTVAARNEANGVSFVLTLQRAG
ncbi:MAG TPA: HAMP domain-containing sensor histidine kinase [Burkholderiales bacterium]|nr:HAMP domain-containing sensor histidine kinase [Burkholderiales bacterium]